MSAIDYSLSRNGQFRDKLRKAVIGLTLSGLVLSATSVSLFLNTTPAHAAVLSHGDGFNNPAYDYILGSWITVDGTRAYCIQLQVAPPTDNQNLVESTGDVTLGDGTAATPEQVAMVNYILNNYANTTDDLESAAIAWAIWFVTSQVDDQGIYISYDTGFEESIFTFAGNEAQANLEFNDPNEPFKITGGALYDRFQTIVAAAETNASAAPPAAPAAVDITGAYTAGEFSGVANVPAGYNQVTLTGGATFDSNDSATMSLTGNAQELDWSLPVTGAANPTTTVELTGSWSTPGTGSIVNLWQTTDGQDLVGSPPRGLGSSSDAVSLNIGFTPILETAVPTERIDGDGTTPVTIEDEVVFYTQTSGAAPFNSPEVPMVDGNYAVIEAQGTLYGPLAERPVQNSTVPLGAPVAGETSITTTGAEGFGQTYNAEVTVPNLSGFYTWVWVIDHAEQNTTTQTLIPADYSFQDDYGIPAETSYVPTNIRFTTELTANRGEAGTIVQDDVDVTVQGEWIRENGNNIPVDLEGKVYYHGTSAPTPQANVPDTAVEVQTLEMTVDSTGIHTSEDIVFPEEVGYYTVQWCTVETGLLVKSYCDDYGVASETFEVFDTVDPEVTTQAQTTAKFGETVTDTAFVTGDVPENSFLRFTAYRAPVAGDPKFSNTGEVIENQFWTEDEINSYTFDEICDIQPIGTTGLTPVTGAGSYVSEPIATNPVGTAHNMYWVEELITVDPNTSTEILLDRGRCGEPSEITFVSWPEITTNAGGPLEIGGERGDRTTVTNALSSATYTVTHELYYAGATAPVAGQEVCNVENRVFNTADAPVELTGSETYEFVSAAYKFEKAGTYYWIERLWHGEQEVAAGYCGNPDETVTVTDIIDPEPSISTRPFEGTATPISTGLIGAGVLLLIGGAVTALIARRVA